MVNFSFLVIAIVVVVAVFGFVMQDLETIGIEKAGYRHRLRREIKNLDTLPLEKFKISKTVYFDTIQML